MNVGALWYNRLSSRLLIRGSWVRFLLGVYIYPLIHVDKAFLSTIVSLDPGVVNGILVDSPAGRKLFL